MTKDFENELVDLIRLHTQHKLMEKAVLENVRLTTVGEVAAGVAHDFNNSLQAILGNAELALFNRDNPESTRHYLTAIRSATMDAASRIRTLQRFATRGTSTGLNEVVDINLLLEDAITQLKPRWKAESEQRGIFIHVHPVYGAVPLVDGNQNDLRSAFLNIIKNAIEAMPTGGTISIETGVAETYVYARITDTGTGMTEETRTRLFEPFYSTKDKQKGHGLGLSSVYGIFRDHGGDVWVKNTALGRGSTIEALLPPSTKTSVTERTEPKELYTGSARVLLVDDEPLILKIQKLGLERSGHVVDTAGSGAEALELLAKNTYHAIFTDVSMPDMNGWQLAERINRSYPGNAIVMVTGGSEPVERKSQYGVNEILAKPVSHAVLQRTLSDIMYAKNTP